MKQLLLIALSISFGATSIAHAGNSTGSAASPGLYDPIFDWTGLYVGATIARGVTRDPSTVGFPGFFGAPVPPPESVTTGAAGWSGGFHAGYNRQSGHVVVGVEGDWQWSGQHDSACLFTCDTEGSVSIQRQLHDFGTIRGRLGYGTGSLLFYLTGGFAFGRLDDHVGLVRAMEGIANAASFSHSLTGGVVGGGIETALAGNWTGRIEYLYMDLGSVSDTFTTAIPGGTIDTRVTSDIRNHITRAGISYRFGDAAFGAKSGAVMTSPHDWRGLYVGANAGYGVDHDPTSFNRATAAGAGFPETFTSAPGGWLGGGQVGYNWQYGQWVTGVETDIQGAGQFDNACVGSCELTFDTGTTVRRTLTWFGTTRGRLGYAVGPALLYGTAGAAYGQVRTAITDLAGPSIATMASATQIRSGWTLGAGIEGALWGPWSAKLEYLYVDLGSVSDTFATPAAFSPPFRTTTISSSVQDHVFRAGLNYRFGSEPSAAW